MMRPAVLLVALVVSGCVAPTTEDSSVAPAEPAGASRVLVDLGNGETEWQGDVVCVFGGGMDPLPRETGARVFPGATTLHFALDLSGAWTGVQLGYSFETSDVTWFEPSTESATWELPITPDQAETNGTRWAFHYHLNPPEAEQECYTGTGAGTMHIRIEARADG